MARKRDDKVPKTAGDYMRTDFVSVLEGTPNTTVIQMMLDALAQATPEPRFVVVVTARGQLKGVVTVSDVLSELAHDVASKRILEGTVETIMTELADLHCVSPQALMLEVTRQFVKMRLRTVVVLDAVHPIGIIGQLDIIRWWNEEVKPS